MTPEDAFDVVWNRAELGDGDVAKFGATVRTCTALDDLARAIRKFKRDTQTPSNESQEESQ